MTYLYKNFAESQLAEELLATDLTLTVDAQDIAAFPTIVANTSFLLTLFDGINTPEIVEVTAQTDNVYTVTRGREGTSAAQWSAGTLVRLAPTAAQFTEFWSALGGNGLVLATSANAATVFSGWNRRRGAAHVTAGATNYDLALPTSATAYDEIMLSVVDSGIGVVTLKQGATTIDTLSGLTDWILLRWSGSAWLVVAGTSIGPTGAAGAAGSNGSNGYTILSGTAVPTTEGVNGDFYIRNPTTTPVLYGPKTGGAWGAGVSLVGPSGAGSGDMLKSDNLSGLTDYTAARANLGLGAAALLAVGTVAGTVAAGDDSRFTALPIVTFTGDKTLALTDAGALQRHTGASAHALTIPPNASVAFPIGTVIPLRAYGAGFLTVTRGAGVTLTVAGSIGTDTNVVILQYEYRILVKEDTNVWVLL